MTGLGAATIVVALVGCSGVTIQTKSRSVVFFSIIVLIMIAELILGVYWWYAFKHYMRFPQLVHWFLEETMRSGEEWITLQIKVSWTDEKARITSSFPCSTVAVESMMSTTTSS